MIPFVFVLAAGLIVAAIVLLIVDRRSRTRSNAERLPNGSTIPNLGSSGQVASRFDSPESDNSADADIGTDRETSGDDSASSAEYEPSCEKDDKPLEEPEAAISAGEAEEIRATEVAGATEPRFDDSHLAEDTSTFSHFGEQEDGEAPDYSVSTVQPVSKTEEEVVVAENEPAQGSLSRRPLRGRRLRQQRKAWAVARNASFARIDRELPSYWRRTPSGDAKAVVSGFSHGREMHLADISGLTFLALRRAVASNEVFELRRKGETSLPHVATEAGLKVAATTPELIHRIFDDRANRMLAEMEQVIERIWSENEWSLAQLAPGTDSNGWDRALESLASFSDIARRLPPAEGEMSLLETGQWDPTRLQLTAAAVDDNQRTSSLHGGHLKAVPDGDSGVSTPPSQYDSEKASGNDEPLDVLEIEELDGVDDSFGSAVDENNSDCAGGKRPEFQTIDKSSWRPVRESSLKPEDLPTRLTARRMGVGDVHMPENNHSHGEEIPALGEDPEHSQLKEKGGSIVRSNARPASIFTDYRESDSPEPDTPGPPDNSVSSDSTETSQGEATSSAEDDK